MESRIEKTQELHNKGFNCAQAVACTYCDLVGIDEETMFKVTEAHGLGMGGTYGTCGAVTGACAILGALNSCGDLENPTTKAQTYALSKELTKRFKEKTGALACRDLKGIETGKVLRSCPDCIMDAAEILEDILERKKSEEK